MKVIAFIFFLFLADMSLFASDITIFGIAIDKPIPKLEKCVDSSFIENNKMTEMCFNNAKYMENPIKKAWGSDEYSIDIPFKDKPNYVKYSTYGTIGIEAIDGNVESISFGTCGYDCQDDTMEALTKKFGKPKSILKSNVQNGFGAQYVEYDATWKKGNIIIHFIGMDAVDNGYVEVDTIKYKKIHDDWKKATNNSKKEL